ncbi:HEAT repeat domain-containing protein [Armatimonas sp.]|uniref:HEAT repeat domain-containing protein n=1 Tax=Armatimonas sp. TaxID=1872638 RepID=UPI00286C1A11|nr:HEAT repeat domain-containing protein [Armatimonas sp.]
MFQDQQQEIPGHRHFFERLKSVETFAEAEKLAKPFPTETLLPELVKQAIVEQQAPKRFGNAINILRIVTLLMGISLIFISDRLSSKLFGMLHVFSITCSYLISNVPLPTKRTTLVANLLYARLRGKHETFYCPEIIRLLGVTRSRNDSALQALRAWLFETLPYLIESDAKRLPEDVRGILRRWLKVRSTSHEEKVVLLLVLASAGDTATRPLAQKLLKSPSEHVREAAQEAISLLG